LPWRYIPVWILITAPVFYIAIYAILKSFRHKIIERFEKIQDLTFSGSALGPIFMAVS